MAVCGFRRIAALMALGRIADCTLGTPQCKDDRIRSLSPLVGIGLVPQNPALEVAVPAPRAAQTSPVFGSESAEVRSRA
eukprot:2554399-Alexandrium_andersonii.AAC.1